MALCLSVSLSQVGVLSKWLKKTEVVFGTEASFDLSHSYFPLKLWSVKNFAKAYQLSQM